MEDGARYGNLTFDPSFSVARRPNGEELRFTRAEWSLLVLFTGNIRKILTRDQLLNAMSGARSNSSDSNVDCLIIQRRRRGEIRHA